MTRTTRAQVAFSSGELDPLLHRRYDYQRFQTGLAACRGFLPLAQGGVTRAPGTIWRGNTRDDLEAVLVPFQFAANDSVVLEFTTNRMRVWRYGELVMSGAQPYELSLGLGINGLRQLQWVQSADVLWIATGIAPIRRIERHALDHWTVAPQEFPTGPFRVQNLDPDLTVQADGETGTIALTASHNLFETDHVGSLMMLRPTDFSTIPLWVGNAGISVGQLRRYGENIYELTEGNNTGVNPPIHSEGEHLVAEGVKWKFVSDGTGIVRITAVTDATTATAEVLKRVPRPCVDDPTYRWSEGAWSARYGYPSSLEIFEQRLVASGTPSEPRTVWFSAVGDMTDFEPSTEADGSFAYTIAGDTSMNRIQSLKRGRMGLHIFALGEEYSTRASGGQPLGVTNAEFGYDSGIGAAPVRPIAPDGRPIFISRDRQRLFMISWSLAEEGNQPVNLSLPSQHLGAEGFAQIVWQGAPRPVAWIRRGSGDLAALIYQPEEEILGWAVVPVAGGFVEALAVTPDETGARDVVTMVVGRWIDGQYRRFVEELAPLWGVLDGAAAQTDAVHLYSARQFQTPPGQPAAMFSLPHLEGEQVFAWTEAGGVGPLPVGTGGAVDLPFPVERAVIGLHDDSHHVETLDLQAATPEGSAIGRRKRIHAGFAVALHRSVAGRLQVVERDFMQGERVSAPLELLPRGAALDHSDTHSGISRIDLPSGHATELALRIRPAPGAPLTVTGIVPIVQESGR